MSVENVQNFIITVAFDSKEKEGEFLQETNGGQTKLGVAALCKLPGTEETTRSMETVFEATAKWFGFSNIQKMMDEVAAWEAQNQDEVEESITFDFETTRYLDDRSYEVAFDELMNEVEATEIKNAKVASYFLRAASRFVLAGCAAAYVVCETEKISLQGKVFEYKTFFEMCKNQLEEHGFVLV